MKAGFNRNIKMIVVIGAVVVILLGILLMLISGNDSRREDTIDPSQAAQSEPTTEDSTSEHITSTEAASTGTKNNDEKAKKLFAAKTDSINDAVAVAKLLETIDLEKNVAQYSVELQVKEVPRTTTITFDKTIEEKQRIVFDKEMQRYAEQMLALITDLDAVEWTYKVIPKEGSPSEVTVYLKTEDATKLLNQDIKKFGASENTVKKLLDMQ